MQPMDNARDQGVLVLLSMCFEIGATSIIRYVLDVMCLIVFQKVCSEQCWFGKLSFAEVEQIVIWESFRARL